MDDFVVYDFRIDVWKPETLPLKRLAEYASELARLFGSTTQVHLLKVRGGSHVQELAVAGTARASVERNLALARSADAPEEVARPYRNLNQYLRTDGGSAVLKLHRGAKLIEFPGCKTPLAEEVVVHEAGTLDGVVIRVGGKDDTVPVWLEGENREKLACTATRPIAKELAGHLFGSPVRVSGMGKWRRNAERLWELEEFVIKSWENLDDTPLDEMVTRLRGIPGSGWEQLDDPQAEWRRIRGQI
jgi:hypothetical protein